MLNKNKAAYEKEHKKFVWILCGIVFSFAAVIPVVIYALNRNRERIE